MDENVSVVGNVSVVENVPVDENVSVDEKASSADNGQQPIFTDQVKSLESEIVSLKADLLQKLTEKKRILVGENAKVDMDLAALGSLQ